MPVEGVEPPRPFGHMVLSHARMPIPPYGRVTTSFGGALSDELQAHNPTYKDYSYRERTLGSS